MTGDHLFHATGIATAIADAAIVGAERIRIGSDARLLFIIRQTINTMTAGDIRENSHH